MLLCSSHEVHVTTQGSVGYSLVRLLGSMGKKPESHYIFYNIHTMLYNNIAKHKRILTPRDTLFSSLNKTLSILSKRNFKNLCILLKTDTHEV